MVLTEVFGEVIDATVTACHDVYRERLRRPGLLRPGRLSERLPRRRSVCASSTGEQDDGRPQATATGCWSPMSARRCRRPVTGDHLAAAYLAKARARRRVLEVLSGSGRRPSAGALPARRAISTRASARRWAGVRDRSPVVTASPRRARASAQSASNNSSTMRSSALATIAPLRARALGPRTTCPRSSVRGVGAGPLDPRRHRLRPRRDRRVGSNRPAPG
jgi:hypothetical protein